MTSNRCDARVLVASDNADDLTTIVEILEPEFADVRTSASAPRAVEDFEAQRPHVVVIGFDAIDKAQRWLLALHRASRTAAEHRHRTVLLCTKAELPAAIHACREGLFDDYVLHWPMSQDGARLAMSVRSAAREALGAARGAAVNEWVAAAVERERVEGVANPPPPRTSRRIMVVDDDEVSRVLIGEALAGEDYELVFAHDAAAALAVLRHTRPDLILMDVRLPDGDGIMLTGRLKALPQLAEIPVLMLTGEARRDTLESSVQAGAIGFIVKPFSRDALVRRLDRCFAA
ncbi:MAG TPA: response regulator [Caldimonas sp.]|nr:response regulator [Caldimonas sp.]